MGFWSRLKEKIFGTKEERIAKKQAKLEEKEKRKLEKELDKKNKLDNYIAGLSKSNNSFTESIKALQNKYNKINEEFFEDLEEILIMADISARLVTIIVNECKKEGLLFDKKIAKLQKNLGGIRKLAGKATFPQVMICASPLEDEIAIAEAKKKGIKIFAIQDTNSNPDLVDFAIPANDDSVKSITVVTTILADAICAARGEAQLFAYKSNDEIVLPEEPKREYTQRKFQRRPQSGQEQTTTTTEVKETTAESK